MELKKKGHFFQLTPEGRITLKQNQTRLLHPQKERTNKDENYITIILLNT